MKVYKVFNKYTNKLVQKNYTLGGLKTALNAKYSWTRFNTQDLEVIEYEAKEVRRLTVDEVKQLNTQQLKDKLVYLIDLVSNKSRLDVQFSTNTTGYIWEEKVDDNLTYYDKYDFNTLDEAIDIVSKY